jgi:hypothetical protein
MNIYKIYFTGIFFILFAFSTLGQMDSDSNTFRHAQGFINVSATFYETEGYNIFVEAYKSSFDDKGIKKLKKKFSIGKDNPGIADADFPNAKVFEETSLKGKSKTEMVYCMIEGGLGKVRVIGFATICGRVKSIEREFYNAIIFDTVPRYVYSTMYVDTIKFAGRDLGLGPACRWMGAHNMQCPDMGQMNWSEFTSEERARQMLVGQQEANAAAALGEVMEENQVDIIFEGQEVKALKRKWKVRLPRLVMGGSNVLVIYYVLAEVRGRYVACVLSHYTDDVGAQELPPLLNEVMKLKN